MEKVGIEERSDVFVGDEVGTEHVVEGFWAAIQAIECLP